MTTKPPLSTATSKQGTQRMKDLRVIGPTSIKNLTLKHKPPLTDRNSMRSPMDSKTMIPSVMKISEVSSSLLEQNKKTQSKEKAAFFNFNG